MPEKSGIFLGYYIQVDKKLSYSTVIPQVRTITRYGTRSVILFNYAESPIETFSTGDSV